MAVPAFLPSFLVEKRQMKKAMISAVCCFGALCASAFTYSAKSYVQNGLIGHFDGIENGGYGVHDPSATEWKNLVCTNLVDHLSVTTLKSYEWADNYLGLSSGLVNESTRMMTKRTLELTSFSIETVTRTGSDGMIRSWEVLPYSENGTYNSDRCSDYEAWTSATTEGYLERLTVITQSNSTNQSRIVSYPTRTNNLDIHFATTYDSITHTAHSFIEGVRNKTSAGVVRASFNRRMAFFSKMTNGRAYGLRIYNRALNEDELRLNDVIDQLRFHGKTPQNAILPDGCGWSFDENGVLCTASGKVLLRPNEFDPARAVVGVSFVGNKNNGGLLCVARLGEGMEGVTNAIYFAWGDKDYGDDACVWPHLRRIMLVAPEESQVLFAIPTDCDAGASALRARVFTAVASRPYDHRLESIGATGTQWLDTGYYANPKTVADFTARLNDLSGGQRIFGADDSDTTDPTVDFSFAAYLTANGSYWAYSCNDGIGFFHNTGMGALNECTRVQVNATTARMHIDSPSYRALTFNPGNSGTRTKTATSSQVIFAVGRKHGTSYERPIKDGVIYSGAYSEDGEFVHTYEPCIVGGRAAFYDGVTDRICFSSTSADFVATGGNVSSVLEVGESPSMCSCSVRVSVSTATIIIVK